MVYLIIFIISRFAAHFSAWSCMTALHSTVICCMFAGMAIPWLIIRLAKSLRADKIMTKLGLPV